MPECSRRTERIHDQRVARVRKVPDADVTIGMLTWMHRAIPMCLDPPFDGMLESSDEAVVIPNIMRPFAACTRPTAAEAVIYLN
jgi:hypothetical protein